MTDEELDALRMMPISLAAGGTLRKGAPSAVVLARLNDAQFITRHGEGWSLTPKGVQFLANREPPAHRV